LTLTSTVYACVIEIEQIFTASTLHSVVWSIWICLLNPSFSNRLQYQAQYSCFTLEM